MSKGILLEHFALIEDRLIADYRISGTAGHSVNKGSPREHFVKEFLSDHLGGNVSIGKGEILDCHSIPGKMRNEFDIIIYKNNYPKLSFGGITNGYLIESVLATIEVKSKITKLGLKQAIDAAYIAKNLSLNLVRPMSTGYVPPSVLNFVIAYDGPKKMETIWRWLGQIYARKNFIHDDDIESQGERYKTKSQSVDAVFVLKRGYIFFNNMPIYINSGSFIKSSSSWQGVNTENEALFMLFMRLLSANSNLIAEWPDFSKYIIK